MYYYRDSVPSVIYSVQRETSDGSLEVITVKIPYQDKSTLHVLVDDIQITSTAQENTPYTWVWDGDRIRITPVVAKDSQVLVRRVSPADRMKHIFDGQAEFTDQAMDENFKQLLWLAQEYGEGSGLHDVFSNINMHGYKITNVGWATDPDDVVTYGQYVQDALGARKAAQEAKQAVQDAKHILETAEEVAADLEQTNQQIQQTWQTTQQAINEAIESMKNIQQQIQDNINNANQDFTDSINLARDWAVKMDGLVNEQDYSSKYYATESRNYADLSKDIYDQMQPFIEHLDDIVIVSQNIEDVKAVAGSINDINVIADDILWDSDYQYTQDYGVLGQDNNPVTPIVGGILKSIADNIDQIKQVGDLIESGQVQTIIQGIETTYRNVEAAQQAQSNAENAAVNASDSADLSKAWAVKMDGMVNNEDYSSKYWATKAKESSEAVDAGVEQIVQAKQSALEAVTAEGTKQVNAIDAVKPDLQDYTIRAQTAATSAQASATSASQSALGASQSASSAQASAGVATEAKNAAESARTASETAKNAAQTAKTAAQAAAQRAQEAADNAVLQQVQADWTVTDTSSKAYIKNKPVLGTLASKNSVAYTEVTDTPNLSVYATKTQLSKKLDTATYTSDKSTFATKTQLGNKLDISTYTSDKATFATKSQVRAKLNTSTYNNDKKTFALKSQLGQKSADFGVLA